MKIVLYFEGNGSMLADEIAGWTMRWHLSLYKSTEYEYIHITQPVVDYQNRDRTMDEDYSLSDRAFYQRLLAQLEPYLSLTNAEIYLVGFSLGASVILGLVTCMANNSSIPTNMEIITLNSDVFFPNYDLDAWSAGDTFTDWSDGLKYEEIRNLQKHLKKTRTKWHHVFNSFDPINYPARFRRYKFIRFYLLDKHYPRQYPLPILNHYYILNPIYSLVINNIIGKVNDGFMQAATMDAAKLVDQRTDLVIRPPSLTGRIIQSSRSLLGSQAPKSLTC